MTRTSLLALVCLGASVLAAPAALAGDTVVLRETLAVDGPYVTLGDLFDVTGEAAEAVVARAPAPGARTSLTVSHVRQVAAENGLDWANAAGVRRITISRDSRVVDATTIADMLEDELFAEEGRVHEVRLSNTALSLHAPVDSTGGPRIETFNYDPRSGMLVAEIAAWDGGEPVRVTARAYATVDVPVLARAIPAGHGDHRRRHRVGVLPVRPAAPRRPARSGNHHRLRDPPRLRPGEPLRGYDLQRPLMVSRGELVTLVFEAPGIQLSVRARAMEDAADGEVARFVNLQSNRTVEALVDGPGRARVGSTPTASF